MTAVIRRDAPWRVPTSLTHNTLEQAARLLARQQPQFHRVLQQHGVPPLWAREPGFATLIHIILEQQVSLASARAALNKLQSALGKVTPASFLTLDDAQLKAIGFSRQKTRYGRELAQAVQGGILDLDALHALPDDAVRLQLTAVKGIGHWSTDIYLLMALRRRDVFPKGDLALLIAAQRLFELPARPTPLELEAMAEAWRPHRATAARILWHFYLSER
jgi:DNA-3-methyladenine glycosylase II